VENLTVNTATALTLSGGWADDFSAQDPVARPTQLHAAMQLPVVTVLANGVAITLTVDGLTIERGENVCVFPPVDCIGGGMSAQVTAGGALSAALNRVVFLNNRAGWGGGLGAQVVGVGSSLNVTVTDSMVLSNVGQVGGGMFFNAGDANATMNVGLDHVLFKRNRASPLNDNPGTAGGLFVGSGGSPSQLLVQNCIFDSNLATKVLRFHNASLGGGVVLSCNQGSCQFKLVNSVLVHNRGAFGGALYANGSVDLVNVTVTKNTATYVLPGGVYGAATVRNSILWGNHGKPGYPQDLYGGAVDHSDVLDGGFYTDLGGNISADPLLVSTHDVHLRPGSPAIDTGTCTGAPTTDFEGDPRPTGASCDMGADEFVP